MLFKMIIIWGSYHKAGPVCCYKIYSIYSMNGYLLQICISKFLKKIIHDQKYISWLANKISTKFILIGIKGQTSVTVSFGINLE